MDDTKQVRAIDASCQTDLQAQLLPCQYPANLIYAQNMLAICMSEMQRVDLNIAQLRFYLREHELYSQLQATAAVLSNKAAFVAVPVLPALGSAPAASASGTAAAASHDAMPGGADAAAGAEAADAAAAADGAADGGQPEQVRVNRRRLAAAVKIAFVMILLEVRTGWFFVYFFAVFLYIGGVFDPAINWFQRRPARTTLEQQLTALRNRQRHAESEQQHAASVGAGADNSDGDAAASGHAGNDGDERGEGSAGDSVEHDGATPADGSAASGNEEGGTTDAVQQENIAPPPPWSHRFIYQLFVMFFMTLLPWWNPDPRYL